MLVQLFLYSGISELTLRSEQLLKSINAADSESTKVFLDDTIREQQRRSLSAMRQGWVQYLQLNPDTDVILRDSSNNIVYTDGKKNIGFNPKIMTKMLNKNGYTILNKDGSIVLDNCRPQWNKNEVSKILSIVAAPVKSFGNNGNVLAFDSFTGEVILDTRGGSDGGKLLKDNKNIPKEIVDELMVKKDSDRQTKTVYSKNGDKEFIEKIVLPYEFVGTSGENMQITICASSSEKDILTPYEEVKKSNDNNIAFLESILDKYSIYPNISIIIGIILAMLSIFALNIAFYTKKDK